ncbi:MAG TPA: hypothetical protein DCR37_09640 [Glaciecola sp.]|nr:hypothetical protein [Glaciecola sp.]
MGIFHGSKFIAVTSSNLAECHVAQIDKIPTGELGSFAIEPTYLPVPDALKDYLLFDTEKEAKTTVKKHLLNSTEQPIIERMVAIEMTKFEIEWLKNFDLKNVQSKQIIENKKQSISIMQKEVATFRKARRMSILTN